MKKILLLSGLFLIGYALSVHAEDLKLMKGSHSAQICIERPENEAILNMVPVKVDFSNNQKLYLLGGQSACIIVAPGDYSFKIKSTDPSPASHKGKPRDWKSEKIKLHVSGGETAKFIVSPKTSGHRYTGGWNARAAGK